jgi:HEAT repeat protein
MFEENWKKEVDKMNTITTLPLTLQVHPNQKMEALLAELSPTISWGDRQIAARKLGNMRDPGALPALLQALPTDPFWMVRTAIIQALEMIGDPAAVPTLEEVAKNDRFQVVRSYAKKAIERLS